MNRLYSCWLPFLRLALLLLAIGFLLTPQTLLGRAGGGGGYGGGGFSGGGGFGGSRSFGGGRGGGNIFAELPWWGNAMILGGVVLFALLSGKSGGGESRHGGQGTHGLRDYRVSRREHDLAVSFIRAVDPDFDANAFSARFKQAFLHIQNAWQGQDMRAVQHFVSDGIFERFTLQIIEQKDMGYRDKMEKIEVGSVFLAEVTTSHVFEILTVQVSASAVDYRVSIETGKYVTGSRSPEPFVEFWSFVRRRGVKTESGKSGLIEGCCPNCNDSIRINQLGKCSSCGAILRSGEYDWILSEITQACEWRPRNENEATASRLYREQHDPGFNMQHLEDRASVVFWRKAMADRLGNVKPLLKVATNSLCEVYRHQYEREGNDGERKYRGGCSVGSVAFHGIVREEHFDYAMIEIRWAANHHAAVAGGRVRDLGQWRRLRNLYVLARRKGVPTNIARTVDSAHCPACGAPESDLESHACEFCAAVLNTGDHDWVLAECDWMNSRVAQGWLAKLDSSDPEERIGGAGAEEGSGAPMSQADVLAWMVCVLAADKEIHDDERAVIFQLARKQQMPEPMIEGIIEAALKGELEVPSPANAAVAKAWMEQMADVALADGVVQPSEMEIMRRLGSKHGWALVDINLLVNKRRSKRSRAAREFTGTL